MSRYRYTEPEVIESEVVVIEESATEADAPVLQYVLSSNDYATGRTLSGSVPATLAEHIGDALVAEGLAMKSEGGYLRGYKWNSKYGF